MARSSVLILADVHSNTAALEAVLEREPDYDEVWFLGDAVMWGPEPAEAMVLLRSLPGVFISGNHDRELLALPIDDRPDPHYRWHRWTKEQLSDDDLAFLSSLPETCVIQRDGQTLRLIHGDFPAELGHQLWPDDPRESFVRVAAEYPEPWILTAHVHVQYERRVAGTVFINPGAIGQHRLGQPLACYGVLEGGKLRLDAVAYDVERSCRALARIPMDADIIADWQHGLRNGVVPARYPSRDLSPLRAMGSR